MKAIVDLFSTDYGLMSIAVILFVIFMSIWFSRFFKRKMDESVQEQQRAPGRPQRGQRLAPVPVRQRHPRLPASAPPSPA